MSISTCDLGGNVPLKQAPGGMTGGDFVWTRNVTPLIMFDLGRQTTLKDNLMPLKHDGGYNIPFAWPFYPPLPAVYRNVKFQFVFFYAWPKAVA